MCFEISTIAVGNGQLALSPLPGRTGEFAQDLAAILAWKPDFVLTLVETAEMVTAEATDLGTLLQKQTTQWAHVPIKDFDVPADVMNDQIMDSIKHAANILATGGRVLVHCRGGCGRSGMVALRIMRATGEDSAAALDRLRKARPCAIETDAQMAWATRPD